MSECIASTTLYRFKETVSQVGWNGWIIYQCGYLGGIILGIVVGHTVSEPVGAGVSFGIYVVCTAVFLFIAKTPNYDASGIFNRNDFAKKFWWVAFYSVGSPSVTANRD
jgi:solute carrier family 6 (neurotransmitter transporter, GABA) member 1